MDGDSRLTRITSNDRLMRSSLDPILEPLRLDPFQIQWRLTSHTLTICVSSMYESSVSARMGQ